MSHTGLCSLDEIPEGGVRVVELEEAGVSVLLVRRGEQVWGYANRCPHFSVRLDFEPGRVHAYRSQVMMCAHHSALFRFEDGHCIEGPCQGFRLDVFEVELDARSRVIYARNGRATPLDSQHRAYMPELGE